MRSRPPIARSSMRWSPLRSPRKAGSWPGITIPGHTELFAQRTDARRYAMMFAGGPLKVVLATVHIPLMGLWGRLNIGAVFQPIELVHQAMVEWFDMPKPRIAVCGVNPHASENGQFGDEEERIIAPAILMARDQGIDVTGPYPRDTIFLARPRRPIRRRRGDVSRSGPDPREAAGVRSGGEPDARACRSSAPAPITAPPSTSSAETAPTPARCVRRSNWRSIWPSNVTRRRRSRRSHRFAVEGAWCPDRIYETTRHLSCVSGIDSCH